MATTPRPFLWQSLQLRAESVSGTAGIAHYYTEEAQSFYLKSGLQEKDLEVEDGHWQELVAGDETEVSDDAFSQLSWHHPSMGTLYGTAILGDILYLLRYDYAKNMGHLVSNARFGLQVDNPITQLQADIKNYEADAFLKPTTLFVPGAQMELGITMGDSPVYPLGIFYVDDVEFTYNKATVGISGRNLTGAVLNTETLNVKGKKTDTVHNLCKWVLDYYGISDYEIQANTESMTIEYAASDTGLKVLLAIADKASGYSSGEDWAIEETPGGRIIIGFNSFRAQYLPKSVFKFNGRSELFKRSSNKMIDGAYAKVYVTGKNSAGHELDPVIQNVETWAYWTVGHNKTYFPPTLENTTRSEMEKYAQVLVKQLKKTGLNEGYTTTIRPQLLVGDFATVHEYNEDVDIGIITEVTHTMGEKGYSTDFVADSGGDKETLLTRSASNEQVYTSSRRNNGNNRNKRIMDFIKGVAQQEVRASGGGGGGGESGVGDVWVDGTSVVEDGIAKVVLTGKQDKLTAGDRITLNGSTISADIAPFSIVDGEMCITYEEEA